MGNDRTTVEISEPIRDRLRKLKKDRGQTYDAALDAMLTAHGYPDETPVDTEYRFVDSDLVFHCESSPSDPVCVYTPPFSVREPYLYESARETQFAEFLEDFKPLMEYFGLTNKKRRRAGSFVVSQDGNNWFGRGLDNFLETCSNQEQRYETVGDIDPHHSERAVYVYHGKGATLLIYGQPSARSDSNHIRHGGLTLLTNGCPTRNKFINLLDRVPTDMSNGTTDWNPDGLHWWNGRGNYGPYRVPETLRNVNIKEGVKIKDESDDVVGYVCDNPYFGKSDQLFKEFGHDDLDEIDGSLKNAVQRFTSTEQALIRTMIHKPNDDTYYEFEQLRIYELPALGGIGGGTTVDIRAKPKGDYF